MLLKRTALQTSILQRHFTKVAIIAGNPSMDTQGSIIMKEIQSQTKDDVSFFGMGGDRMKKQGLGQNYGTVSKMHDKQFYPYQNTLKNLYDKVWNPVMSRTNIENYKVFQELEKNHFFRDLLTQRPDYIIGMGNFFLMRKIFKRLEADYAANPALTKPGVFFFNNLNVQYPIEDEHFMDHCVHTSPYNPGNWQYYQFPSIYRGQQGLFNAYKYLYGTSENHRGLVNNNRIYLFEENPQAEIEELVFQERINWRKNNGVEDSTSVFFVSPGSEESEMKVAIPMAYKAVNQFIESFGKEVGATADNFTVVVSLPEDASSAMRSLAKSTSVNCRSIVVDTPAARYGAMAASDFGACMEGEAIAECVGMQLPTIILDNLSWGDRYWSYLYNQYNNDIGIHMRGEIYPEVISMQFAEKLCEIWGEMYSNPKSRYVYMKRYERTLFDLLPEVEINEDTTQLAGTKRLAAFEEPNSSCVRKMISSAEEWKVKRSDAEYQNFHKGLLAKGSSSY